MNTPTLADLFKGKGGNVSTCAIKNAQASILLAQNLILRDHIKIGPESPDYETTCATRACDELDEAVRFCQKALDWMEGTWSKET